MRLKTITVEVRIFIEIYICFSPDSVVLTGRPLNLGQVVRSVQSMSQHFIRSHADKLSGDLGSAIESTLWVVWKHAEFFTRCGEESLDVFGGQFITASRSVYTPSLITTV